MNKEQLGKRLEEGKLENQGDERGRKVYSNADRLIGLSNCFLSRPYEAQVVSENLYSPPGAT